MFFLDFRARSQPFLTDETIQYNRQAFVWVRQRARLYRLRGTGLGGLGVSICVENKIEENVQRPSSCAGNRQSQLAIETVGADLSAKGS